MKNIIFISLIFFLFVGFKNESLLELEKEKKDYIKFKNEITDIYDELIESIDYKIKEKYFIITEEQNNLLVKKEEKKNEQN